ncbi:MAG: Hsp20/alpha crystallin family protein [Candidatus Dormiibacterota bacterium]
MTRWDQWSDMFNLEGELSRFVNESYGIGPAVAYGRGALPAHLPVDIRQTEGEFVLEASVPGFTPDQVEVTWDEGILTIRGEKKTESEYEGRYLRRERRQQSFWRQLTLPHEVKYDQISAVFADGVLTIRIPRVAALAPKRIPVGISTSKPVLEAAVKPTEPAAMAAQA